MEISPAPWVEKRRRQQRSLIVLHEKNNTVWPADMRPLSPVWKTGININFCKHLADLNRARPCVATPTGPLREGGKARIIHTGFLPVRLGEIVAAIPPLTKLPLPVTYEDGEVLQTVPYAQTRNELSELFIYLRSAIENYNYVKSAFGDVKSTAAALLVTRIDDRLARKNTLWDHTVESVKTASDTGNWAEHFLDTASQYWGPFLGSAESVKKYATGTFIPARDILVSIKEGAATPQDSQQQHDLTGLTAADTRQAAAEHFLNNVAKTEDCLFMLKSLSELVGFFDLPIVGSVIEAQATVTQTGDPITVALSKHV